MQWCTTPVQALRYLLNKCLPIPTACPCCCAQNAIYGQALASDATEAPSSAASSYHDTYVVEPAWGRDLSKLPPGVSRIVGGARKLFEVR
jgi:hypothetical protein